jgi:hypothetical protein
MKGKGSKGLTPHAVALGIVLVLALSAPAIAQPVGSAARSLASTVSKALGLSKAANANSKKALADAKLAREDAAKALAKGGPQGPQGVQGPQGPQGLQGPKGQNGAPGSAVGYARLLYSEAEKGWRADDATSTFDGDETTRRVAPGVFCFSDVGFIVHNVQATLGNTEPTAPPEPVDVVQAELAETEGSLNAVCPTEKTAQNLPAQAAVFVRNSATGALVDPPQTTDIFVSFD